MKSINLIKLNYELFIAKRIITHKVYKSSISSPIIKIAITAISLGLIIMMIAVATSGGLQHKIKDKIAGFKGHIQISNFDTNHSEIATTPIYKNQFFYPKFKAVKGIKNIQVYAYKRGLIRTQTDFEGILFKGVSTDYHWSFFKEYLLKGTLPDLKKKRTKEVLLSKYLAKRLQLELNDTLTAVFLKNDPKKIPSQRKYILKGIYSTGFQEFDKNIMIGDLREIQRLNGWNENQIDGFEVVLEDFTTIEEKGIEIYNSIPSTLSSNTIKENYAEIFEWIALFDNNTWVIIMIMIIVAGINMITALLVLILERVQMIGILKALGSSTWSIQKIFLYNAGFLTLKGLFWGNLIGLSVLGIQHYFGIITLDPATYHVATLPVYISFTAILLLNVGTVILCFLMLLVPSYIITKIQPSTSIRFA